MFIFNCVDELSSITDALGLSLQLTQLAGGSLRGDLRLVDLSVLQLCCFRLNRPLHVRGAKQANHQLICLDLTPPLLALPARTHGVLLPDSSVFGLATHGDVHLVLPERTVLLVALLDQSTFQDWCLGLGCECLLESVISLNWLSLDPQRFEDLRLYLLQLFEGNTYPGHSRSSSPDAVPIDPTLILADLLPLLIEALVQAAQLTPKLCRPPARLDIVKAAQQWMDAAPEQPLTLDALCRSVYASRRSLIQGFREHLGMGPMAYLKLQRLHAARRALQQARSDQDQVRVIARRFGFLNPGHFSRDYRCLFGELPSVTLGRSPEMLGP